jgi:hypothetical protein
MMIRQEENSLKDLDARQKIVPFAPVSTSYGMGWKGLQAVRYRNSPLSEFSAAYTPGRMYFSCTSGRRKRWTCAMRG